ncbi:hypothetical protein NDU88_011497 [Pleurodeles waltl]|uniref:Uncharacterized protein n=1 Tax=Pleurodeles waltl TaxID=8319 RepID=A0AAV7QXF0_PLEWA|nr:hypothetical protein NDU88_011497 [Pleurodeles waltl]
MVNASLGHTTVLRWLLDHDGPPHLRNILLNAARWNWRRYVLMGNRATSYSPRIPLMAIPNIGWVAGQHRLSIWPTKGIQTIGDIFEDGHFLSNAALASAHDLGQGWFIAYSALHQLVRDTWKSGDYEPPMAPILHELLAGMGTQLNISWIYKTLLACPEEAQIQAKARSLITVIPLTIIVVIHVDVMTQAVMLYPDAYQDCCVK